MAGISAQELADLVPCSLEQVSRLQELGLLTQDEDGVFPSSDVHVVRLMAAFEEAGISVEDVARGVAGGELSFPLGLFLPEPVGRAATFEELAAQLGRPPDLVRRLSGELGFPPPADDRLRREDAELLSLILTRLDLADEGEFSRFARLYGGTMQRLVGAGLQFFDRAVRQRVEGFELSNEEKDSLVYERAAGYTELVNGIVPWLQRRHREHAVLEYLVGVTEGFMEERGIVRQTAETAACDRLPRSHRLHGARRGAGRSGGGGARDRPRLRCPGGGSHRGCRPVKWLGDGVMFYFSDSGRAILSGLDLIERTEQAVSMPARIGVNAGPVVVQEGDYFGRTVNIAARIADYAGPRDLLVSEEAKRTADADNVEFELVGDVELKGVPEKVRLHRAIRVGQP